MAESTGLLLLDAENNDLSGLTITEEGSNDLSISSGAALHGSLGYRFLFSGNTGDNLLYFTKTFTYGNDIYLRHYFYIPSSFASDTNNLGISALYHDSSNEVAKIRCYNSSGTIYLDRFYYRTNTAITSVANLNISVSRDTLHYLEMRYKSGSGDGVAELWYNGTSIASVTGLTNNNYQARYTLIGNTYTATPTANSEFYIDDVKVDSAYIGAYADVSSGDGSLVGQSALVGGGVLCGQGNLIN